LGTLISHGIFIFPRENELIFFGKMKISWEISSFFLVKIEIPYENGVPKLALIYDIKNHTTLNNNTSQINLTSNKKNSV
jgi:hypothetical protein